MSPYRTRHIERLELLHSLFPKSLVFAELADAYRVAGDLDLALKTARAGLEQHPDYVEGFLVLARALVEGAKPRQAEAALRQVLDLEPTNVEAQEALATLKRVREATEELESDTSTGAPGGRGMELPHGWEARWSYGQAERAARQTEDAPPAGASGTEHAAPEPAAGRRGPVPEVRGQGGARAVIGDQLAELIGWEPTVASRRREPRPGDAGGRREPGRGASVVSRAAQRIGPTAPALTMLPAPNRNVPLERHRPQREATLTPLTDLLVGLLEYYDPYYRGGSSLTRLLAVGIAEELGLGEPQLTEISLAAVLRDIGRLALGGRILSRGEAEQHSQPRRGLEWHVELTLRMLEGISLPQRVIDAVRHHHERWDGRGYPDGLAGDAIPLEARILSVADSFSAMIRPRPYRLPRRVPEAVAELERESGRQFDPAVIDAALRLMATNDLRGFGLGGRRHVILIHPFGPDATVAAVKLGTAGFLAEVAADLDMGAERLRRVPVEAVVLSGMLPVDRATRFVEELRRDSLTTSLPVLVIDADPPGTRVSLLAAGADACLGGEASFAQIAATLGGLVGQAVRERVVAGDSGDVGWKALRGDLEDFGLNWLLQMMSYHGHTAAVVIERGEEKGIVYMVDGEPHHAQTRARSGVDALREMLAWGRGHFAVALDMKPPERTITESLMHLLLDEAVAADHGAAGIVYGAIQAEAP